MRRERERWDSSALSVTLEHVDVRAPDNETNADPRPRLTTNEQ
jgi:hypothetical protein